MRQSGTKQNWSPRCSELVELTEVSKLGGTGNTFFFVEGWKTKGSR